MKQVRIGLLGAGVVGASLIQLLEKNLTSIRERYGIDLQLTEIATRSPEKLKGKVSIPVTNDVLSVTKRSDIDMIVELMGGTTLAYEAVSTALHSGKTVVTANKALLSEKGRDLFSTAKNSGAEIGYEAAVAGSIPIIRILRDGLASCEFEVVSGILNGTTNFILTKMEQENWDYATALAKAQELGFAEADPTFDVEGIDAAHKISLLASLAFREFIPFRNVQVEGISRLQSVDIRSARSMGYRLKLLGISKKTESGILTKVHPTLIPLEHPLANVMNESNAVFYKTKEADSGMVTGKGAGGLPTASAVLSDIIYYAGRIGNPSIQTENNLFLESKQFPSEQNSLRYYLRFTTVDKPGVLAEISKILGKHNISIASVQQKESQVEPVTVIVVTHSATEGEFQKSLLEIDSMKEIIREKTVAIRILEKL